MCDKKYEQELTIKQYDILRDYVKHEDSLINNRLTWLLVSQGLIFSAFSSLFKPISDLTSNNNTNTDLLISQMQMIQCLLSVLGLLVCITSFFGILAAFLAIDELENSALEKKIKSSNIILPSITGGGHTLNKIFRLGKLPPLAIPIILLLGWLYIIYDINHCLNYWFWVVGVVGFILGSTLTIWVYRVRGYI